MKESTKKSRYKYSTKTAFYNLLSTIIVVLWSFLGLTIGTGQF